MAEKNRNQEILLEVLATLLIVLMYYVSTMPEWKIQMYIGVIVDKTRLGALMDRKPILNRKHEETIRRFRQEISAWEHARKSGSGDQ